MDDDMHDNISMVRHTSPRRIAGLVLLLALVASWFIWGPLGLVCYVGGRFNSSSVFALALPFVMTAPLAVVLLPVVIIYSILHWRSLSQRAKVHSSLVSIALAGLVGSFGLGFAGIVPSAFDMFVGGFAGYAKNHADVAAIQTWLNSLDRKAYIDPGAQSDEAPIPPAEQPPAIVRLHPVPRPHGVRIIWDTGGLTVRLLWGGGFIGHWGIEVGDKSMKTPPDSEGTGYRPLAPGAWVWYERQ